MGRHSNYFTLWLKFAYMECQIYGDNIWVINFGRFQTYKSKIYPEIYIIVILKEEVRAIISTMGDKRRDSA